jgi:hypothetical protein
MSVPFLILLSALSAGVQQPPAATSAGTDASQKQAASPEATSLDPDGLPVSLARIQKGLAKPQTVRLNPDRQVFRVEIFGQKPTIEDILGKDFLKGPVPYGGMTHQEFLSMVTPKDVQGMAAFSNKQGIIVAATSVALQWALQAAIHKYDEAKDNRAKEAARKEVQDALDALRRARRAAGLEDK